VRRALQLQRILPTAVFATSLSQVAGKLRVSPSPCRRELFFVYSPPPTTFPEGVSVAYAFPVRHSLYLFLASLVGDPIDFSFLSPPPRENKPEFAVQFSLTIVTSLTARILRVVFCVFFSPTHFFLMVRFLPYSPHHALLMCRHIPPLSP